MQDTAHPNHKMDQYGAIASCALLICLGGAFCPEQKSSLDYIHASRSLAPTPIARSPPHLAAHQRSARPNHLRAPHLPRGLIKLGADIDRPARVAEADHPRRRLRRAYERVRDAPADVRGDADAQPYSLHESR
jgi:hypothetical protein